MSITGGDVESMLSSSLPSSAPESAPGSPRNKVKFLCSHGGKILPRPADGHLKYVGGETRVISVPRNITFSDLMKKLASLIEGKMILKYQLIPEDLDALVTVKSDEDLRHMIEEHDRHELLGAPRLRTFLFPANPIVIENQMGPMDCHFLEQRYINSVNGIVVHPTPVYSTFRRVPINSSFTTFSLSSACSSPRTPPETVSTATNSTTTATASNGINPEITTLHSKLNSLSRVRSTPCLCNVCCNSRSPQQHPSHCQNYLQPQPQPQPQLHHPHLHPHCLRNHSPPSHAHQSPKPLLDRNPHKNSGPEHLSRTRSMGVADYCRYQMEHASPHYARPDRGGHMFYQRGSPYDEYSGNCMYERTESPPGSPLAQSPSVLSRSPSVLSRSPSIKSGRL